MRAISMLSVIIRCVVPAAVRDDSRIACRIIVFLMKIADGIFNYRVGIGQSVYFIAGRYNEYDLLIVTLVSYFKLKLYLVFIIRNTTGCL